MSEDAVVCVDQARAAGAAARRAFTCLDDLHRDQERAQRLAIGYGLALGQAITELESLSALAASIAENLAQPRVQALAAGIESLRRELSERVEEIER